MGQGGARLDRPDITRPENEAIWKQLHKGRGARLAHRTSEMVWWMYFRHAEPVVPAGQGSQSSDEGFREETP